MIAAGNGSPTIILEAGYSSTTRAWSRVFPELAKSYRVVAYDRMGMGSSESSPRPRTSVVFAEELHAALASAGVRPPYVLVAHSAGGLHARVFAGKYPGEVLGAVLIDPSPEDFYERAQREQPIVFARLDSVDSADSANASEAERAQEAGWDESLKQAKEWDARYSGPIIVLSSPRADLESLGPIWTDEHRRWAARKASREYQLVDSVGHAIQRERPAVVVEAVRRVIARARRP
jgi:pimeloyl-ACP methyl ester carboxylesterase